MHNIITVSKRNIYGVDKFYPLSENAHLICDLIHQKTITMDNIAILKKIGFTVMVEPDYPQVL